MTPPVHAPYLMSFRHLTGFRFFSRRHGHISDTNPCEKSLRKRGAPIRKDYIIVTLDPNKFAEKKQQRLHIGNHTSFKPHISLHKQSGLVLAPRLEYDTVQVLRRNRSSTNTFPPDTKAFLYYSMSPGKPRIAGELRLRVASSDDATSFESGSDLLRADGRPWSRPLHILSKCYFPLYEKLREERLIPDDLDTALSTLPKIKIRYGRSQLLYTFNDTFIVDFSHNLNFFVITEHGVEKSRDYRLFEDFRGMFKGKPYTGSALARFERSTLLDNKGTRTVVLRFLKMISPVKCVMPLYDGYICCPKEGDVFRRALPKLDQPLWSVNIDKSKKYRGLQLLWDA